MAELELPDGTVLDAPDGADPKVLVKAHYDRENAAQADQARKLVHGGQESFFPNMATASGKALVEIARKGMNMLNINGAMDSQDPTNFGSAPAIHNAEIADKPYFDAPGGKFGQMVADTAATAPIGGPIEAGIAKMAGPLGGSLLARLATSQPVRAAASGAANAAITADPGQRLVAAEKGGALGGTLGALQSIGARAVSGIVKKSDPLQLLEGDVARSNALPGAAQRDLFVPVSQGADPNDITSAAIGRLYRGGLPFIPGVAPQILRQSEQAGDTLRGAMLQLSSPEGHVIPLDAAKDMQLSTQGVKDAYGDVYDKLRKVDNIAIPKNFDTALKTRIRNADPQIPESAVDQHVSSVRGLLDTQAENSPDGMINGWNLKNTRDNVQAMNADTPMAQREGLINTTKDYIDQIFGNKMRQAFNMNNKSTQDILGAYKTNASNYENFRPLAAAVDAASPTSGKFTFGTVAKKANDFTDIEGIDQAAKSVLGQRAVQPSQEARIAGYAALPFLAKFLGGYHTLGVAAGANALATKTGQKMMYGDTALQNAIEQLAQNNPKLAASLGYAARSAATSEVGVEQ